MDRLSIQPLEVLAQSDFCLNVRGHPKRLLVRCIGSVGSTRAIIGPEDLDKELSWSIDPRETNDYKVDCLSGNSEQIEFSLPNSGYSFEIYFRHKDLPGLDKPDNWAICTFESYRLRLKEIRENSRGSS